MTASQLQQAIDGAWAGVEGVVKASVTEAAAGKALAALKSTFVQRALPATATSLPADGNWEPWTPVTLPGVGGQQRSYVALAPEGLSDLAVHIELVTSELATVRHKDPEPAHGVPSAKQAKKSLLPQEVLSTETSPEAAKKILGLGQAAVQQQVDYAMKLVWPDQPDYGPEANVCEIALTARETVFNETPEALTMLVHTTTLDRIDDDEKKKVKRQLAGGALVGVPWEDLRDRALVMLRKPTGVTWYTACDLLPGWDQVEAGKARISVVSRLLLDLSGVSEGLATYRAPIHY